MTEWSDQWTLPEVYAGVRGKGAQDATYKTALLTEPYKLRGEDVSGGSADMYKCFDQIIRLIAEHVLKVAKANVAKQRSQLGICEV